MGKHGRTLRTLWEVKQASKRRTSTPWPHLDEVSTVVRLTGAGNGRDGGFQGLREEAMRS